MAVVDRVLVIWLTSKLKSCGELVKLFFEVVKLLCLELMDMLA